MKKQTISQWLNELEEPYRSLALESTTNLTDALFSDASLALLGAFDWNESPQGHEYWRQVYIDIGGNLNLRKP